MAVPANSVAVATGSPVVTGTLTSFVAAEGDLLVVNGVLAVIASRTSSTELRLKKGWPGPTVTGAVAWDIVNTGPYWQSSIAISRKLSDLVAKFDAGPIKWDAAGSFADRPKHDAQGRGFTYLSVDPLPFKLYVKLGTATDGSDWSLGQVVADLDANTAQLLDSIGGELAKKLQVPSRTGSRLSGPIPTWSVHHIELDAHRHVFGRLVDWGNGLWTYYYRSAIHHFNDYASEIRAINSFDEFQIWDFERKIVSIPGANLYCDVGGMLDLDTYAIICPVANQNGTFETPVVFKLKVDDTRTDVKLAFADGATTMSFAMLPYWMGEYRNSTDPNAQQIILYGANKVWRVIYENGAFSAIIPIIQNSLPFVVLSEGAVGYAPDGNSAYMIIRNSLSDPNGPYNANELRRPMLLSFMQKVNGAEVWSDAFVSTIAYSTQPPYIIPYEAGRHILYTRSSKNGNTADNYRGHMVAVDIDPTAFIASRGTRGYTTNADGSVDWMAQFAMPTWPHLQGGPTKGRDGFFALAISYQEAVHVQRGSTQGAPCALAVVTNRPAPTVSPFGVLQMINGRQGRPETVNGQMQVWTDGTALKTHADPTKRLEGPDGISVRRTGNVTGSTVEGVVDPDTGQVILRWGRASGDSDLAAMNIAGAIWGADVRHLRGQWVTLCVSARPGPNFSCVGDTILWDVFSHPDPACRIGGSDGTPLVSGTGGSTAISLLYDPFPATPTTRRQSLLVRKPLANGVPQARWVDIAFAVEVPSDCSFLSFNGIRRPLGTAVDGDYLDVRRIEFVNGPRPTQHKVRPLSEERARVRRITRSTYPPDVLPGTVTTAGALISRTSSAGADGSYERWEIGDMIESPTVEIYSTGDGAKGFVRSGSNNFAAAAVNASPQSVAIVPRGLTSDSAAWQAHVTAKCRPFAL